MSGMTDVRATMQRTLIALSLAASLVIPVLAHAQAAPDSQLRSTIYAQIMADPRSQTMTQTQIYSMVNALTLQAEQQGLTPSQITYRPQAPGTGAQAYGSTLTPCSDVSCSISRAFGLDGSIPLIPIALFVLAALFILIFGIMREMGHPHTQFMSRSN
jgi:hypothetical protein